LQFFFSFLRCSNYFSGEGSDAAFALELLLALWAALEEDEGLELPLPGFPPSWEKMHFSL
jgi:hypothetical protein